MLTGLRATHTHPSVSTHLTEHLAIHGTGHYFGTCQNAEGSKLSTEKLTACRRSIRSFIFRKKQLVEENKILTIHVNEAKVSWMHVILLKTHPLGFPECW